MRDPTRGPTRVDLLLRVGVAAWCLGTALVALRYDSRVGELLFNTFLWSDRAARLATTLAAWILLALVPLAFWRWATPVCPAATVWALLEVWAALSEREIDYDLVPAAHSLRILAPVALVLWWRGLTRTAMWTLRVAIAATFAAHGIEALRETPYFVDLVLAGGHAIGLAIAEDAARQALLAIGILDQAVAVAVLVRSMAPVLVWAAFWGLVTALARVVHGGLAQHPEVLVRVVHVVGPLFVLAARHYDPAREAPQ